MKKDGLLCRLDNDENIMGGTGVDNSLSEVESRAPYIGLITGIGIKAMGCLLEDGTLLTTLHTICDIKQKKYLNFGDMKVFFVKGKDVFCYSIDSIYHDGMCALNKYGDGAITFDYARVKLSGNPVKDLGGSFSIKNSNLFEGLLSSEPLMTIAISSPIFHMDNNGRLASKRIVSVSQNESFNSTCYMFRQSGWHRTIPGFSGQPIFTYGAPNEYNSPCPSIYAIHVGRENISDERFGFKISEYLLTERSVRLGSFLKDTESPPKPYSAMSLYAPEANKNSAAKLQKKRQNLSISKAVERTKARFLKHGITESTYQHVGTRELADHFAKLGSCVFDSSKVIHTDTNKIVYTNPTTGWNICYDKYGKYSTVHDEHDNYVELDGIRDKSGKKAECHFFNK
ncbi:MAG: hypothetical protein HOL58_02620 [Francisellaceae bacterium]|jgi:hypothetical protein|nr:hypothetical protein [Francisellaceae bacterium]